MSIIHDALKKVQNKTSAKTSPTPRTPDAPKDISRLQRMPDNLRLMLLCGFLILVILAWTHVRLQPPREDEQVMITATRISLPPVLSAPVNLTDVATPGTAPEALHPAEEIPVLTPGLNDPLTSIRIEGIMDMGGGKHVALMNGNMYEEGQTIYGRTIRRITLESVTLIDQGQEHTLAVKPPKP